MSFSSYSHDWAALRLVGARVLAVPNAGPLQTYRPNHLTG